MYTVIEKGLVEVGYEQLTSLNAAVGLVSVPAKVSAAWIQAESQAVRVRSTTAPTATVGQPIPADSVGVWMTLGSQELRRLLFIEQAASAKLNVTYYRPDDA